MKKIVFVFLLLLGISCKSNMPEDIKWEVTKETPNPNLSINNIEVSLNKKIDIAALQEIARNIKDDNCQYNKIWIFYRITDTNEKIVWATTHFTPNLEINIVKPTVKQDMTFYKISN